MPIVGESAPRGFQDVRPLHEHASEEGVAANEVQACLRELVRKVTWWYEVARQSLPQEQAVEEPPERDPVRLIHGDHSFSGNTSQLTQNIQARILGQVHQQAEAHRYVKAIVRERQRFTIAAHTVKA